MTLGRLRVNPQQIALAVATAIVLAGNVYFGVGYFDARRDQGALSDQFRRLELSLQRLVAARDSSTDSEAVGALRFPQNPPGVQLTDLIIRVARESGVEVLSLRTAAAPSEVIGSGTYRAARVDLRLRGDPERLSDFFDRIERGGLQSLVIDNLTITTDGGLSDLGVQILAYATTGSEAK